MSSDGACIIREDYSKLLKAFAKTRCKTTCTSNDGPILWLKQSFLLMWKTNVCESY